MIDEGQEAVNIGFLRGHVAQLTQSISPLSLKPDEKRSRKEAGGSSGGMINKCLSI